MARQIKNMAVLFADISDSTSLYQKLGDTRARHRSMLACRRLPGCCRASTDGSSRPWATR
ncbi:MAG: hypothetical protein KIT18_02435 [Burkholderiales bacterium]|nr:hypothetical protein [Burkholderiales bacterium]